MKIKNYQTKEMSRDAPEGFPNKAFLGMLYASKGMGKTNLLVNIVKAFGKTKTYDKVYLFSPTASSDSKYDNLKSNSYEFKVFNTYTDEIFREVIDEIKQDIEDWKEYIQMKELYEKSKTAKSHDIFKDDELIDLFILNFKHPEEPRFKREPWSLIIFDDLASNKELMSNKKSLMNSIALLVRHLNISMLFSVQIYRNAVPKMIRNNLDWWILAKSKSKEDMASVAQELTSYATMSDIATMWEKATLMPYNFFCINLMMGDKYRFTKNLNEPIE